MDAKGLWFGVYVLARSLAREVKCSLMEFIIIYSGSCTLQTCSKLGINPASNYEPASSYISRHLNIDRLRDSIVQRIVESQRLIQPANALQLTLLEIPTRNI